MSQEGQLVDKKSLRAIAGRNPDWDALVKAKFMSAPPVSNC